MKAAWWTNGLTVRFSLVLTLFLGVSLTSLAQDTFEHKQGDTVYVMKKYYMVFLMRGDKAFELDSLQLEKIQAGHMAHLDSLAKAGKICMAGPFDEDTEYRGIAIYTNVKDKEEARALAEADPAVKAGRIKIDVRPWWAAKGTKLP
ncbi:MAG: hypothetical protein KDD36_06570 [Flavobacteriales bacterium]|nr:hypothetical protein [Flavobacteriales bacterium]